MGRRRSRSVSPSSDNEKKRRRRPSPSREDRDRKRQSREHRRDYDKTEERVKEHRRPSDGRHHRTEDRKRDNRDTEADRNLRRTDDASADPGPSNKDGAVGADNAAANGEAKAVEKKPARMGPAGGVYIPPFKLAQMMRECDDKKSAEYQRLTWDALRKSINGLINKVNSSNIKSILPEIFAENLLRGRGLFCRSVMKSQMASPTFSPVYAALVAVVNTKFPELGELLLKRVILQFRRAFKRNDKQICLAGTKFIAHMVNQQVAHEIIALEMLFLLLEQPSDDSVEVAVNFSKECGATLQELVPQGLHSVFERLRAILHEGEGISTRTCYIIEGLFAVRKKGFEAAGFPAVPASLDLVETEDQITHEISLDEEIDPQMYLDVFKVDPQYEENEAKYQAIKREILGEESDEEGDGVDGEEYDEDSEEEEEEEAKRMEIQDATETNLVNLRRTIYLTIMSSMDFEEAGHKLLKIQMQPGQEPEIVTMLIECCSQEKTYLRYYGLLGQRFCYVNRVYQETFEDCFVKQYQLIHRLETNKLRNVAKLFAHLLSTDAISWSVLAAIRLTEEDTTSSSRIFVKVLFQELSEVLGLLKLNERLNDPQCAEWFGGIFPKDTARNMRFSINFFTSIGLGGLTDVMRDILKNLPKMIAQQQAQQAQAQAQASSSSDLESSSESDSDSSSGSSGSSDSDDSSGSSSSDSDSSDSD